MIESSKMPRRERERLRHRAEILEAARKVLADKGLNGVTVEQVAREADFAVGSIYRHFSSKEQLIDELLMDLVEPFFEELDALHAQGLPFEAHLEAIVRLVYQRQLEDTPFLMAMLQAPGAFPAPGTPAGRQLVDLGHRIMSALDRVLAQGQVEGVVIDGDRTPLAIALTGAIDSTVRWALFSGAPPREDACDLITQTFLNGARRRSGP